MNMNPKAMRAIAFSSAFLAVGIPYWQIPYPQASLPDSLYAFGLMAVFAAAAILRSGGKTPFAPAFIVAGSAVPGAVMIRIIVGVFQDPTSHNLWPFEAIIASAVGFPVALVGALLGELLDKIPGGGSA